MQKLCLNVDNISTLLMRLPEFKVNGITHHFCHFFSPHSLSFKRSGIASSALDLRWQQQDIDKFYQYKLNSSIKTRLDMEHDSKLTREIGDAYGH